MKITLWMFGIALYLVWAIFQRKRRGSSSNMMYATCCGQALSEWFIDKDAEGWGMKCLHCKRVSPWISHQQFRDDALAPSGGRE